MAETAKDKEKQETKEETKPKPKRDLFKLILIVTQVLTLVLIGGLGFLYFKMFSVVTTKQIQPQAKTVQTETEKTSQETKSSSKQVIYHLDPFVVNLLDEDGTRYLKTTIDLVLDSNKVKDEIDNRLPEIRDAIIMCLSDRSFKEIADITGKMHLREDIKRKLNSMLESGKVEKVLFSEFIVQ